MVYCRLCVIVTILLIAEHMVESIKAEINRLQKSRQMQHYHSHMENSSDGNTSEENCDSPRPDKPLFTFRQVRRRQMLAFLCI